MKKIVCLLFLIQTGLMMGQTETLANVNGKKVIVNPYALNTASNGLTTTGGNLQLGGTLTKPSVLTTTPTSTLAIIGLNTGLETDNMLTADANGILKTILKQSLTSDDLGSHIATANLDMSNNDIKNIQTAFINNELEILDKNSANTKYFNLYKNDGKFYIWNSATSSSVLSIDETNNTTAFSSTISFPYADGVKIMFLNSKDATRIEHNSGWIIGNVSGKKIIPDSGRFNWSNYSNPSGTEKELMRLNATGIGIGTTAPTAAMHVVASPNPITIEGLVESAIATDIKLVIDAEGIIKKSVFPKTYKTPSLNPGDSYSVTLQANIPITSFLVMTANGCVRTALTSFRSYNNTLSFLGGQGRNIAYTATVLNEDGSSLKLEASGVVACQDGGGLNQFDFTIIKTGGIITITNNGNVAKGYNIVQTGL